MESDKLVFETESFIIGAFNDNIEPYHITEIFDYIRRRKDLTFEILTKNAKNMFDYFNDYVFDGYIEEDCELENYFRDEMYKHIRFGVTAENQEYLDKQLPYLLRLKTLFKDYHNQDLEIFVALEVTMPSEIK